MEYYGITFRLKGKKLSKREVTVYKSKEKMVYALQNLLKDYPPEEGYKLTLLSIEKEEN